MTQDDADRRANMLYSQLQQAAEVGYMGRKQLNPIIAAAIRDGRAELLRACEGLLDGLDANDDPEQCGLTQEEWNRRIAEARTAVFNATRSEP